MKQLKAILLVMLCTALAFTSQAQSVSYTAAGVAKAIDSIVAAGAADTVDAYSPILTSGGRPYFSGSNGCWTAQIRGVEISGTTALNAIIQVTTNGTDWNNLYGTSADTFALTDVTTVQTKQWHVDGKKVTRARIRVLAASSTQSSQIQVAWLKD